MFPGMYTIAIDVYFKVKMKNFDGTCVLVVFEYGEL